MAHQIYSLLAWPLYTGPDIYVMDATLMQFQSCICARLVWIAAMFCFCKTARNDQMLKSQLLLRATSIEWPCLLGYQLITLSACQLIVSLCKFTFILEYWFVDLQIGFFIISYLFAILEQIHSVYCLSLSVHRTLRIWVTYNTPFYNFIFGTFFYNQLFWFIFRIWTWKQKFMQFSL